MVRDGSPPAADAVANGGGVSSPQSRRRSLHSPWASVVRGDSDQNSSPTAAAAAAAVSPSFSSSPPVEEAPASENSLIENSGSEPQPEITENNGDSNAGGPRRPAWNRPVNGAVDSVSVMGETVSWPALSEATRPGLRSLSDTSRPASDGSTPLSQTPIMSQPSQRSSNSSNTHGNSTGNNPHPARPRSRNRGAGGGGSSLGTGPSPTTFNQPPPPFPVFDIAFGVMPGVQDNSVRGPRPVGGVGSSPSHSGNERSNSRRGNYGPRPRGDGQYHNNRRDLDRRDGHPPHQFVPPPPPPPIGYMPPPLPHGAASYMGPPPMTVFPGQIGFDMAAPFLYVPTMPPESFRAMPVVPPMPPIIYPPANESPLTDTIVNQIDFYFSDDNLAKDSFLRRRMDENGWVPVSLIASFRRVEQLTKDIPLILESLKHSTVLEVQGDKIRRRNDWSKWLFSTGASRSAPETVPATSSQEVSMDDAMTHTNGNVEMAAAQLSEESTSQSRLANGDNAEEAHSSGGL